MFELYLTKEERNAIDFCGNRYWHGDELRKLLVRDCIGPEDFWSMEHSIHFNIPQAIALEIKGLSDNNNGEITLLSDSLANKLRLFLMCVSYV